MNNFFFNKSKVAGFSLIELMIAMVIGLFLLAGIAASYVSSKSSGVKRNEYSVLEDNGRLALEVLSRAIEHAGYSPARTPPEYQFITATTGVPVNTCPDGTVNIIDASIIRATSDNVDGDSIGLVFHGDSNIFTDCSGAELPANCRLAPILTESPNPEAAKIYSSFYLDSVKDKLMCAGSRTAVSQVISEGVENIQFLYGVDMVDDNELKIDRYIPAALVGDRWNDVLSVQIAVLIRSLQPVKSEAESKEYTLLNEVVTTPSDRYQRAVFSSTVYLRNTL